MRAAGGGAQESLFTVTGAVTPGGGAQFVYRGAESTNVDDAYIEGVLDRALGHYVGRGGVWDRLRLLGAGDEEVRRAPGRQFAMWEGFTASFDPDGEPAFRFSTAVGDIFTLTGDELVRRMRARFEVPQPKPEEERRRALDERLAEEREAARTGLLATVGRVVECDVRRKAAEGLAAEIAALFFVEDGLTREGEAARGEAVYRWLLAAGYPPHKCLAAAGSILHQAGVTWAAVLRRYGRLDLAEEGLYHHAA